MLGAIPLALSSPKLAGKSQYGLANAERVVNTAVRNAADRFTPPIITNVGSQIGSAMEEEPRAERKSGGRVDSHEAEADRLVMAAERAKRGLSAHTEGLLNTPDDAVASALEIANRSI